MTGRKGSGSGIPIIGSGIGFGKKTALLLLLCMISSLPNYTLALGQAGQQIHELITTYEGGWIQDGLMFDVQTVATTPADSTGTVTDLATTPDGITIHGLNILTPATSPICLELYTKSGPFSSAASNSDEWDFLGSFTLLGQGPTTPTTIPLGSFHPIVVGLGETQAFYVTTQDEQMRYTALDQSVDPVTGEVFSSSGVHFITSATERTSGIDGGDGEVTVEREKKGESDRAKKRQEARAKRQENLGDDSNNRRRLLQTTGNRQLETSTEAGLSVQILTGVAKNYPFAESWPHRVFNGALLYTLGVDSTVGLTSAQIDESWAAKRGSVTCDLPAVDSESYPSVAPSEPKVPTASPIKSPTKSPTGLPTSSPSGTPTTLESTIEKVATTLHGGLKQSGCMFDIRVPSVADGGPPEGLTVIALEMSTFLTSEICVEVYTKDGTYQGFEQDVTQNAQDGSWGSPTWSILGAATVVGKGEREPTHIPIGSLDPVYVAPGERRAFYVTLTKPEMRYTEPKYDETSGTLFSGSPKGHLEILVGSAVAYPFEETWEDRIFNGAVIYTLGDVGDGKYDPETNAENRERQCPDPSLSPTQGPTKVPTSSPVASAVEVVDTTAATNATEATDAVAAAETDATEAAVTSATAVATEAAVVTSATAAATDVVETVPTEPSSGDVVDTVIATSSPPKTSTSSPIATQVDDPSIDSSARLADTCPSATPDGETTKDVEVSYSYTVIIDSGADATAIVSEMENELHRSLVADKCGGGTDARKMRVLQEVAYQGFNSNPPDAISNEGCGSDVSVTEGQECYLVSGGVTAVVPSDADENSVKSDVGSFTESVLSDPTSYEPLGVSQVDVVSDADNGGDNTGEGGDGTGDQGEEGSDTGDLTVDGAKGGNEDSEIPDDPSENASISTTGVIIIAALGGTLLVVILALIAMKVRKKRRANARGDEELFHEFPDEEDRAYSNQPIYGGQTSSGYGVTASSNKGYRESFAPLSSSKSRPPPPPGAPPTRTRSSGSRSGSRSGAAPAMILNEEDDISLFTNDVPKGRFTPSGMLAPDSPGSRGSRGSAGSKKSVEFVRAGQSFSSRQSNQPEDTVDL